MEEVCPVGSGLEEKTNSSLATDSTHKGRSKGKEVMQYAGIAIADSEANEERHYSMSPLSENVSHHTH
jgi:hypothetical protein